MDYLKMPWSIEKTIENLEEIKALLQRMVTEINFEGKGEQDVEEISFDFDRAISAMQELQEYHETGMTPREVIKMQHGYAVKMTDLEDYNQLGTLEEVREAVEKWNECKNCGYKIHSEGISKLNSCNDCGLANACVKRPEYGKYCRINCYDWRKRNER